MAKIRLDQKPTLTQPKGGDYFPVLDYEDLTSGNIPRLKKSPISSLKSAQPERVIIIDTTLTENIEGKAYSTFAAAKTYMETYPEQRFCVELPAGDFGTTANDHITLSEQWEIHGNKTKIVAPIDTKIIETGNMQGIYNASRSIQNCTISEGFIVDTGATGIKCYHVYDCVILKMSTDTGETATTAVIVVCNSRIKTGDESETSTKWFGGIFVSCIVENLNIDGNTNANFIFIGCNISSSNTNDAGVIYEGCDFIDPVGGAELASKKEVSVVGCNMVGTSISAKMLSVYGSRLVAISDISIISEFNVYNSFVRTNLTGNRTIPIIYLKHSELRHGDGGTLTITELDCDAVSSIDSTIAIPTRNMNIVYSTDGGTTMSNDPTGATHYGICKDLTARTVNVSNYMWFAMPE